jgi:hypothetical protein
MFIFVARKRKGSDRQRWTEEMEIACHRRRIKRERIKAGADVKLAAKAFLLVNMFFLS